MIEQRVQVIRQMPHTLWVRSVVAGKDCVLCSGQGCAASWLGKSMPRKPLALPSPPSHNIKNGEQLIIGIAEGQLLKAAVVAYIFPLLGLLLGALLAQFLWQQDSPLIPFAAALGLFVGMRVSHRIARHAMARRRIVILRRCATGEW